MRKLAVILLVLAVLGTGILTFRNFGDGSDLSKLEKQAGSALYKSAMKAKGLDVTGSQFTTAGVFTLLVLLAAIALIVLAYMKKPDVLFIAGLVTIGLAILMIFMNPSYNTGAAGPASARVLALIFGAITILGSLAAVAVAKKAQKTA